MERSTKYMEISCKRDHLFKRAGRALAAVVCLVSVAACVTTNSPTLYQQLGEKEGIAKIVDAFVAVMLKDPRIRESFNSTEMKRFHRTLNEQFCVVSDGPCTYTGDPMKEVHQGLLLTNADFNALVEDLQIAMDMQHVPSRSQNKLLAKFAPMQRDVVSR